MAEKKPLINYSGIIKELQPGDTLPASDNLVGFTSALNTAAPNDTANTSSLTASGGTTNQDAAIVPKGDGALLVQVPDGTSSRGNKRGNKSVDLQMSRAMASHVASGVFSSITGGHNNIASGSYSVVSGGANNESTANCTTALGGYSNSATYDFATVSGGAENVASGEYSTISGGSYNTASGDNATISGGASHDAQGDYNVIAGGLNNLTANNSTTVSGGEDNAASINYATVSGGKSNQATNEAATVAGGISNQSTAIRSSVSGGSANLASGDYSSILGGNNNTSSGTNSSVLGGRYLKLGNYSAGYNASSTNTTVDLSATTNIFITNDADLIIGNTSNTAMSIRLYEPNTSFSYTGANYTAFKAQAQSGNVTYTLPASDGTSGQMLTTNGSGTLSWASVVLTITGFTAALNTASPNNTVNASSLTASGGTTNQDAVIAPKGTGALLANIPDGGATGGNKRGSYAVDLQTKRSVNTQVASGNYSTIAGGQNNTASGNNDSVSGGGSNTASGSYSAVSGGYTNTASGYGSAVSGGHTNTASGYGSAVSGGYTNTASGSYSAVSGGYGNTASGGYSAVLGGDSNTTSGSYSAVLGGRKLNVGNFSAGYNASTSGTTVDLSSQTNLFVTNDANLAIGNTSGSAKELRLYEPNTSFSYTGANYTAFKAQSQSGDVTYTLPASDGTSGQSLTTNGSGTLAWASVVGLTGFTSALNTASPNNTVNASSLTASGGTTNQDAVIAPKGTGAFLTRIPDNTATGGNKRGTYAVDLQTNRTVNTQVASGNYSTIAGGYGNTASGGYSAVSGGAINTASGSYSAVSGGYYNTASGGRSAVIGGESNTASGSYSAVSGGAINTASGSYSAVSGGYGNTASGDYSAVLGGRYLKLGNYSAGYNASSTNTTVDLSATTNIFITNDADLIIGNTSNTAMSIRLYEPNTSFSYTGANYTAFKAQAQSGNVTYTLPASDGTSGQSLTTNGSGTLAWASVGGLTGFTSALNTASPNNTVNASSLTASGGTTNQDAVIAPKGVGALLANIPDNAATGGNKRGSYAVDLQTYRTVNTQVASGNYSTIAGGYGNTASSICVGSLSGYNNNASGSYSVIAGGNANSITGSTSAIGGGTGNSATHDYAVVAGGSGNTASGDTSVVAGGYYNTASGSFSAVLGGETNTASGDYSAVLGGAHAIAYLSGSLAQSGGMFSAQGDAQSLSCALRIKTTNATAAEMFLDGASARMSIPNNTVWLFRADIVAVRETYSADERAGFTIEGVITKKTTAGSTTFVGTPGKTVLGRDVAAWDSDVVADTTNGALKLQVTGEASKNILWVAFVRITEVRA